MATNVSGVSQAQQAAQVAAAQQQAQGQKPQVKQNSAPQDTVTISAAGKAANQAQAVQQAAKPSGDVDRDGDNH